MSAPALRWGVLGAGGIASVFTEAVTRYTQSAVVAVGSRDQERADEFAARHDNVSYFPAYEMATVYQPMLGRSYFEDGRENFHVNKRTVKFIMNHFFKWYAPSEPLEPFETEE
jgi:hypothetical protein